MADQFPIVAPQVTASAGVVSDYIINIAFNQLTLAVRTALNTLAGGTPPIGPAGGDLSGNYPNPTVAAVHATSGTIDNVVVGGVVPAAGTFTALSGTLTGSTVDGSPVGATAPSTGAFTTLSATGTVSGAGFTARFATPGPIGNTTPSTGAFTTLSATSTVSGTGFTAFMASPPPIGSTAANTGAFTTLSATGTVSGAGFTALFASPPSIGSTAPGTGAFTTLSASSTVSGAGFTARFSTPGPIGNTTPSTGAFTTLSATSTITPSSTAGIVGTTTNDNANAGSVGEYVTATSGAVSLTSTVSANGTSISLTAGDWDVVGAVTYIPSAALTGINAGVSTVSATSPAVPLNGALNLPFASGAGQNISAPMQRLSLSATTTVYLVVNAIFASGTCTATSMIRARRVR